MQRLLLKFDSNRRRKMKREKTNQSKPFNGSDADITAWPKELETSDISTKKLLKIVDPMFSTIWLYSKTGRMRTECNLQL